MDYPYVVLRESAAASKLETTLTSAVGRDALSQAGFGVPAESGALTAETAHRAAQTVAVLSRPTRALALVDVSGSMATPVPGAHGATRMDLARSAIENGASLAQAATDAGFADQSHLTRQFKQAYGLTPGRWATAVTTHPV